MCDLSWHGSCSFPSSGNNSSSKIPKYRQILDRYFHPCRRPSFISERRCGGIPMSSHICLWFFLFSASLVSSICLFMVLYCYKNCYYLSRKIFMITKEKKEIGNRIRFLLKEHQTSQTDVARKLDEQTGIGFKAAKTKVRTLKNW